LDEPVDHFAALRNRRSFFATPVGASSGPIASAAEIG
jgi:hypothetical protein